MNLRNRLVNSIAAAAVVVGMAGGIANAQTLDTADADTDLLVSCPVTSTVELTVLQPFQAVANSDISGTIDSDKVYDQFTVDVNMNCNWTPGWIVNASITDFEVAGIDLPGFTNSFDGELLALTGGERTRYTGPTYDTPILNYPLAGPPSFEAAPVWSDPVAGAWSTWLLFGFIDLGLVPSAAPGESQFQWDAQLVGIPSNLQPETYTAKLTIDLVIP